MSASTRAPLSLRYEGAWRTFDAALRRSLLERAVSVTDEVRAAAARIVADVRERGDAALRDLARRFDRVALEELEVAPSRVRDALDALDAPVRRALERAASNIAEVHHAWRPLPSCVTPEPGVTLVRRPDPLRRVGVYAPGGRASYPSSVLMAAVPAKVAGVNEVVLCSPPGATQGEPAGVVLAAAAIAGVDRVFSLGGAGAIAAMAFGTETVPRVDRIVGPGNAFVAAAKLLVADRVGIDCPAGPSELVVIVDGTSDVRAVALEMVAQAEHDPQAVVVAVVVGEPNANRLRDALSAAAGAAVRRDIVEAALRDFGGIVAVDDVGDAIALANEIAPEHLLIVTDDAARVAAEARNAGSVFVGATSSVAFGDYLTGANHVLPTGGAARSDSGLSPLDFIRWTTIQTIDAGGAARLADDVGVLATAESLPGHAATALQWRRA